jgi:hypothetical protein
MRRALLAAFCAVASVGFSVAPSFADSTSNSAVTLSFDFSDNGSPPSASGANFHIQVDVLPESTPGIVRVVALPPKDSGVTHLVCRFQPVNVDKSLVRCDFNFTAAGTWTIRAQYATDGQSDVSASAVTNIRVGY